MENWAMNKLNRRQATAGLMMAAASLPTWAAQGRGQGRQNQSAEQQQGGKRNQEQQQGPSGNRGMSRGPANSDDIYGAQLMTAEERNRYRETLNQATNEAERTQIREEHQRAMLARARSQGADLAPPVYGQHMMTMEERQRVAQRMQDAANDGEREMIRNEHRQFIQQRARELGVDVPPVSEN
jgi:truncated hemoglobin YjbI